MSRNFMDMVRARMALGSAVSVGLDATSRPLLPDAFSLDADGITEFHKIVVEATRESAAVYKPQIAGYEALGSEGITALIETIAMTKELAPEIPIIVDAKRGDIGNTNSQYAQAIFDVIGGDAITVSPYMGRETMAPYLERKDKGVIVLCRTSNPGADHYQGLIVGGVPLYQHIAHDVAENWNASGNCALVVGATAPQELRQVRKLVGDMPILVPGIGTQGGSIADAIDAGADSNGNGLMLHVSRSLLSVASQPEVDPGVAVRAEMQRLVKQVADSRS